ncbi:calcium-binding protein [Pseudoruegeria sp. SK021]|uniref:calcium-binding protein n=1 Tax=Pseudoruegeria sp. SK021 TaxID=1933035 RepID=UPI000A23BE1F|nr:hypothetical protein [Pseudoruegeria sp. SK021]OSP53864.1 hypothetical protein BV911_15665 [Pseudoruegeria sp. SK021]
MNVVTLTGDYGYSPYKISGLEAGTLIDAETASWIHDNDDTDGKSSPYPFMVYDSPGAILDGGRIIGNIDQTSAWRSVYDLGNSAGIRAEDSPGVVIRDWRITDTWDAIRVSWNSPDFLIEDVWVSDARDDAVENDRLQSGTIRDSLFDGVFAGLSIDPSSSSPVDGHNETVTLEGVLLRLQLSSYNGEITHGSFIKTDSATDGEVTPNLRFIDNVFALEDVNHRSYRSMFDAWDNTIESSGNFFLNLSDTPLPSDYPMPPAGWTILQGQEARDYWQNARTEWINAHPDDAGSYVPDSEVVDPSVPDVDTSAPVIDTSKPDVDTSAPAIDTNKPDVDTSAPAIDTNKPDVDTSAPVIDTSKPDVDTITPVTPDTPDVPRASIATFSGTKFKGDGADEIIVGNAQNNTIDGKNGDDTIRGGDGDDIIRGNDGADVIWGDAGADIFIFTRLSDSRDSYGVDTIMDFTAGDRINLSMIDANRSMSSDQAFDLVDGGFTGAPGELTIAYDAASGFTVVSGNVDRDPEAEFTFMLAGNVAVSETDFML